MSSYVPCERSREAQCFDPLFTVLHRASHPPALSLRAQTWYLTVRCTPPPRSWRTSQREIFSNTKQVVLFDISATPSRQQRKNDQSDHRLLWRSRHSRRQPRPAPSRPCRLRPAPLRPRQPIFGSAPPIIQLALSISTAIFVVTVDFVHYFSLPPASSLCALASGSPPLALSLRPAWLAPRLASPSAPESTAFSPSCSPSTVILAVAVSGPTPVPVPAEPLPDMISINGACHFALTSSSASAQPPGRPPGRLPEGSPMDGLQPSSQVRPSPAPRPGAAQLKLQIAHPAPVICDL